MKKFTSSLWDKKNRQGALCLTNPNNIRSLLLFYSYNDLISFLTVNSYDLSRMLHTAFAIIGPLPEYQTVRNLAFTFPNAKVYGVFDNTLSGRVLHCKIAVWLKGKKVKIHYMQSEIKILFRGKLYHSDSERFSLYRFSVLTGFRSTYRTINQKVRISFNQI